MKPQATIENGKFTFTTPAGLVFREQSTATSNIREASDFAANKFGLNPVELAQKNGLTKEETEKALYVLVWPTKGGGCGQYITIRETSAMFAAVKDLRAERIQKDADADELAKHTISITLSSRGWGDYSSMVWTGDKRTSTDQILKECQELLANGHDVDQPNQSAAELIAKIEDAKGSDKKEVAAKIESLEKVIGEKEGQSLVATEREARAAEKSYNDLHNEGGEGYVPEIWSAERLDNAKARLAELKEKISNL